MFQELRNHDVMGERNNNVNVVRGYKILWLNSLTNSELNSVCSLWGGLLSTQMLRRFDFHWTSRQIDWPRYIQLQEPRLKIYSEYDRKLVEGFASLKDLPSRNAKKGKVKIQFDCQLNTTTTRSCSLGLS